MPKKERYPRYTSPVGVIAGFSALVEPSTNFKPEGEFNVKVRFTPESVAEYVAKAQELSQKKLDDTIAEADPKKVKLLQKTAKLAASPFKPELDDDGEETGNLVANFKMNHKVKSKKTGKTMTFRPALFDAKGKPTTANPWSGSELKVNFEMSPYFTEKDKEAGVSLRLYAVQIIKLVSGGNGDAGSYGFGEEDGFSDEGETSDDKASDDTADDSSDGEDDTDF